MSEPQTTDPAKLVIGVFLQDKERFAGVFDQLLERFGPVDILSPWFAFDFTSYYAEEMGSPLFRRMMAFERWVDQSDLVEIKLATNAIEKTFHHEGRRVANIDPGYLLRERFVLATGKNYVHRIYIGKGIYADLTLIFQGGKFQILSWTYPDYAQANVIGFLHKVRKKYIFDRKRFEKDAVRCRSASNEIM